MARVKRPARTLLLEDLPAYAEATLHAIEPFAEEQFDLVIYGCTAAGFLGGPGSNARMVERLRERTRATVVSTAGAMIDALRSAGVSETAVVTPYLQPVNDGLRAYLESSGVRVEVLNSFFCKTTAELGAITQEQVLELALTNRTPRARACSSPVRNCRLSTSWRNCAPNSAFRCGRRSRPPPGPAPRR